MNGTARVAPGGGTGPATVADYAAEVRTHLADLPQDQVDDLTDGLEADLADALADPTGRPADMPPGLTARFGAPAEYARELRAAAGLPDPGPQVPVRR
ncbi:HAAS signaling domain-containing protein, partial [Cellulomonas triticagri]